MTPQELGNNVKVLRTERGWSQKQLADYLGASTRTITRIEKGEITSPTLVLRAMASVFGVPYAHLAQVNDPTECQLGDDTEEEPTDLMLEDSLLKLTRAGKVVQAVGFVQSEEGLRVDTNLKKYKYHECSPIHNVVRLLCVCGDPGVCGTTECEALRDTVGVNLATPNEIAFLFPDSYMTAAFFIAAGKSMASTQLGGILRARQPSTRGPHT